MNNKPAKKKQFGQHFLRDHNPINEMLATVSITRTTTVVEIGCGDGILTRAILNQSPCKALHVFEIDKEWADVVRGQTSDPRLHFTLGDVLAADLEALLSDQQPLILLANLPYQITFPLFQKLAQHRMLFSEGVVMIQEEAAQRLVATSGRRYGSISLLLQSYFNFTLKSQVPPSAFNPPPKVMSRLIAFTPKATRPVIPNEVNFWKFIRACFITPRQTMRNNLKRTHFNWQSIAPETLKLRAQQMNLNDFLALWATMPESQEQ